jgi:4'-phosphopantetheinyl transferase
LRNELKITQIFVIDDFKNISKEIPKVGFLSNGKMCKDSAQFSMPENVSYLSYIGRLLTNYSLCKFGYPLSRQIFSKNPFGKPYLVGGNHHFNISHSKNRIACIVDDFETGIDIEYMRTRRTDVSSTLADVECSQLTKYKGIDTQQVVFYKIWVIKESYIKSIGQGLSCPLKSFGVIIHENGSILLERYDSSLPVKYFRFYEIGKEYCCAICCSHQEFPLKVQNVSIDQLLNSEYW